MNTTRGRLVLPKDAAQSVLLLCSLSVSFHSAQNGALSRFNLTDYGVAGNFLKIQMWDAIRSRCDAMDSGSDDI